MRKSISCSVIAVLVFSFFLCSCSGGNKETVAEYLGDYSYSDPAVCMVYEPVEGETDENGEQCYGIQYRKINDLEGLLASGRTCLIYFYSSMDTGSGSVTAAVEDLAQVYNGTLTVLMLDAMMFQDKMEKYDIEAVPEFVLVRAGQTDVVFEASTYGYWTIEDVIAWLQNNDIA